MANGQTGKLFIVSTPIGNLEDITIRAKRVLEEADYVAAEDTRHTVQMLNSYGISNKLISFFEYSDKSKVEKIINLMLEGNNIALVSDAGTPIISDPGWILVKTAADSGIEVVTVPGACAAISALTISALPANKFIFEGFLPKDNTRNEEVLRILNNEYTSIIYESPHQLLQTLKMICEAQADRQIAVCKELTKIHETVFRGTAAELVEIFSEMNIRGEYIIVISGKPKEDIEVSDDLLLSEVKTLEAKYKSKQISKILADKYNISKNRVYDLILDYKAKNEE